MITTIAFNVTFVSDTFIEPLTVPIYVNTDACLVSGNIDKLSDILMNLLRTQIDAITGAPLVSPTEAVLIMSAEFGFVI